jgi:uncharacterized repeat protein (TIGR01451 family)
MKFSKIILGVGVASIAMAATITYSAFAWHPEGAIVKKVQNITTGSALSDADSTTTAVAAKPGDTLKYVIEIRNDGNPDSNGYNDMAKTVMTDTLPAGIELASNPAQRTITENIGLIKPGQKVTKEYLVTVTTETDGSITNTACFTGDSTVNDSPQQGCNPAVVTITVPEVETPVTPIETPTEETPVDETPAEELPAELPKTGAAGNAITVLMIGLASYAAYRFVQSKRELFSAHLSR